MVLVSVSKFLINKFASLGAVVVYTAALFFPNFYLAFYHSTFQLHFQHLLTLWFNIFLLFIC